jgi:hypothetical protein
MWTYHQKTGHLFLSHRKVAEGYSGAVPAGLNNPDAEHIEDVGPIPRGLYAIGELIHIHEIRHDGKLVKLKDVMRLEPINHLAHNRKGFLFHGSKDPHLRNASHGCIILLPNIRKKIAKSGIKLLHVYR